jgi:hypothetical protein
VYFQFVCNEINAYPVVDDRNEHIGPLDFDQTGLAANGIFYLPAWFGEKPQSISIFKVAEKPDSGEKPKDWYEFDGRSWGGWGGRW